MLNASVLLAQQGKEKLEVIGRRVVRADAHKTEDSSVTVVAQELIKLGDQ